MQKMGRKSKYPWGVWFKLNKFMLIKGQHFNCGVSSMCQAIRNYACKEGFKVRVKELENGNINVTVTSRQRVI